MQYTLEERVLIHLRPTCFVCKKPVEGWDYMHDFMSYSLVFKASCHGFTELCSLDRSIVENFEWHRIEPGYAFQNLYLRQTKYLESKNE